MSDQEFLRQIEDCTLPKDAFTHRNHVRLAWLYLNDRSGGDPTVRIAATIQRYATSLGAATKYNHGLTMAWMNAVETAMAETSAGSSGPAQTFDAFIAAHPELLDRGRVTVLPT